MLIANVDLPAAHQRVEQEGRWRTSDPDDASIAVDAQATRRQCAPCFAAPIRGRRQVIGEFESRLILLGREPSLACCRRVHHWTLLFCARAATHSRRCAASTRHRAWAACDRVWRKYSCGHPNTPRGAGSSAYFQDVAHGHLCVQSRSHFSLRLAAFDAWLGSLDDGISVNIVCCRSSIDCLCTGAFAGRSSGRRTPSKHPAASR